MAKSKIVEVDGENVSFEYNDDNQIVGVFDHTDPLNPTSIDPTTDRFLNIASSNESAIQMDFQRFGGNKDSYTNTVTLASQEVLNAFHEKESKDNKINNLDESTYPNVNNNIANPNIAPSPPPGTAFAAYKQSRGKKVGTDFFTYPLDIDPNQDHLKISKYTYARNEEDTNPGVQGSRPQGVDRVTIPNTTTEKFSNIFRKKENLIQPVTLERVRTKGDSMLGSQLQGSVMLPMPKVVDTNGCEWGESEVNIFGLAALGGIEAGKKVVGGFFNRSPNTDKLLGTDALSTVAKEDLKAAQQISRQSKSGGLGLLKNFKQGGSALLNAAAAETTARVTGQSISQDQILARTSGRVLNPNAELLFQGPVLRDFNFDFLMIARSREEGREIRKIIRWFKSGMAPKFNSSTFLKTPDVFTLQYQNGPSSDSILKTVNRFSPGGLALRTIAVDYAVNGYWSAYEDSQPVAIKMSLNFAELRPIYAQDQNDEELIDTVGF